MNKILFFFCGLASLLGIGVLFTTTILNKVLPILGRAAFQSAAAGSYTPGDYIMNFTAINIFAVVLIIVSFGLGRSIYKKEAVLQKILP